MYGEVENYIKKVNTQTTHIINVNSVPCRLLKEM